MLKMYSYQPYTVQNKPLAFKAGGEHKLEQIREIFDSHFEKGNCGFLCKNKKGFNVYKLPPPAFPKQTRSMQGLGIKHYFFKNLQGSDTDFRIIIRDIPQSQIHFYETGLKDPEKLDKVLQAIDNADGDVAIFCRSGIGIAAALSYAYLRSKNFPINKAMDIILKGCSEDNESYCRMHIYDFGGERKNFR